MVQYCVTPWRTNADLKAIGSKLYPNGRPTSTSTPNPPLHLTSNSSEERSLRHAIDTIAIWVRRGNCPHLVESTGLLVSAQLCDATSQSPGVARLAYASSFSRFVTGVLDGYQDKKHKQSMFSIAKSIGLRATFVELRHQCTHEELPPLGKLRKAVREALVWLYDEYWAKLDGGLEPAGDSLEKPEFVTQILQEESLVDVLRRYLTEDYGVMEGTMRDMEYLAYQKRMKRNSTDDILEAIEVLKGEGDARLMLKGVQLFRKVLKSGVTSDAFPGIFDKNGALEVIDFLPLDERYIQLLEDSDDEDAEDEDTEMSDDEENAGWKMWEGPWVPKPIGMI